VNASPWTAVGARDLSTVVCSFTLRTLSLVQNFHPRRSGRAGGVVSKEFAFNVNSLCKALTVPSFISENVVLVGEFTREGEVFAVTLSEVALLVELVTVCSVPFSNFSLSDRTVPGRIVWISEPFRRASSVLGEAVKVLEETKVPVESDECDRK
jgi:hypothetical protein